MSTIKSSTTSTTAYQVVADTTGTLVFQTGATPTTALTIGTDQSVTFAGAVSSTGNQTVTGNLTVNGNTTLGDASTDTVLMTGAPSIGGAGLGMGMGFRNRIINGAMVIYQRNAGASLSLSSTPTYLVDRWETRLGTSTSSTAQQSSTAPAGFVNSVLLTIGTGASPSASTGTNYFNQKIEGFNCADLGWGTSNAVPVTVSFWVRSSLTGTFGVTVCNDGLTRSYPTSYTISAANTWEQKTITVPGSTSGTFTTNNTGSVRLIFDWGNGSDYKGTANTWANADYRGGATGTQSICATSGATWYVTGVQLEKGSTATAFDYRPIGTESNLCYRYFYRRWHTAANAGNTQTYPGSILGVANSTSSLIVGTAFPVPLRATPSFTLYQNGVSGRIWNADTAGSVAITLSQNWWDTNGVAGLLATSAVLTIGVGYGYDFDVSAEL
jgi:hypothetical protein